MLAMIAVILLLAVASYAAVWAAYSFHYGPTVANSDLMIMQQNPGVLRTVPTISAIVNWFERYRLLPDAYTRGLILGQIKAQHRSAYFVGEFRRTGWWYYFPVAFLVKTPLAVLMLFICGLVLSAKTRSLLLNWPWSIPTASRSSTNLSAGQETVIWCLLIQTLIGARISSR
jgi:hypothetical protein